MNKLFGYLRHAALPLFLFSGTILIFSGVMLVSYNSGEAVPYALLLCGVFAVITFLFDIFLFRKKAKSIEAASKMPLLSKEILPNPTDPTEEGYQRLISLVTEEYECLQKNDDAIRTDLLEYFSVWVHQIKTPISAMRLMLQSKEEDEYTGKIRRELFKTEMYVDMALQYTRLESLSADLVLRNTDLNEVIKKSVRKFAPFFIEKRIKLRFNEINTSVVTDRKWIEIVFDQIISNALKYTRRGSISIYRDENNPYRIVVEDTGIGISPEDLPRVFERGFTGINGRIDQRATGLGLYLVKRTMDLLSHTVEIQSDEGRGTRVFLDFSQKLTNLQE